MATRKLAVLAVAASLSRHSLSASAESREKYAPALEVTSAAGAPLRGLKREKGPRKEGRKEGRKDRKAHGGTCKGGSSCPNPCGSGGGEHKYHKHCSDKAKFLYCKSSKKCQEKDCDPGTVWNHVERKCMTATTVKQPSDVCALTNAKLSDLRSRCVEPGAIYSASSRSGGVLHKITLTEDGTSGTSKELFTYDAGDGSGKLFDLAILSSGEAYGVAGGISVVTANFCRGTLDSTDITNTLPLASGMCADFASSAGEVYVQGRCLRSIDTTGDYYTFATMDPTAGDGDWCAGSAGDMVLDPADGLIYSAVSSCGCGSRHNSALITVDPATGNQISIVGCFTEDGKKVEKVLGMAIDGLGRIVVGTESESDLFAVNKGTAELTRITVSGAYDGTDGLASVPCATSS